MTVFCLVRMVVDEVSQQKINQLALSVLVIVSRHAPKMTVMILIDSFISSKPQTMSLSARGCAFL